MAAASLERNESAAEAKAAATGRGSVALAVVVAATLLNLSIAWGRGKWDPVAFALVALAFGLVLYAAYASRDQPRVDAARGHATKPTRSTRLLPWSLTAALVAEGLVLLWQGAAVQFVSLSFAWPFFVALAVLALGATMTLVQLLLHRAPPATAAAQQERPLVRRLRRGFLFGGFAAAGALAILSEPAPKIDVWYLNQGGAQRILDLENPYTQLIVDLFGPGTARNMYPYPPVALLLQVPFYAAFGDVRWAQLAGMLVVGATLSALARRGGHSPLVGDAMAALVFCSPRVLFILQKAWVEPACLALLLVGVLLHARGRVVAATITIGLAAFSKQYLLVLLPLLIIMPGYGWRRAIQAGLVAAGVALPFFLWDPAAFVWGNVGYHLALPPRPDANSMAALLLRFSLPWSSWIGIVTWPAATLAVAWKHRAAAAGPWVGLSVGLFCFYLFGWQAFSNYYWLLAGLLLAVAALAGLAGVATPPGEPSQDRGRSAGAVG